MKALVLVAVALAACLGLAEPAFAHSLGFQAIAHASHAQSWAHGLVSMSILAAGIRPGMTANERRLGRFLRDAGGHGGAGDGKREISPEQIAEELRKSIDAKHDDVMKKADEALTEAQKSGKLSEETKSSVDQALTGINTLREQLSQIEQKMARKPGADGDQVKSYGAQVTESDRFKAFVADGAHGKVRIELKAITAANAGAVSDRQIDNPDPMPRRTMTIRDLLTVVPTDSGSVDYAKQTTRTNNAAPVAEGAAKPTSAYVWTLTNVPVRTIAHLAKLTRQAIDDVKQLQGEVEQEMRYGLSFVEEVEILTGDGTGEHLSGLITNATAFVAPITISGATMIDNLRLGLLQAELALYPSDGIALNPADWAGIELTKDSAGGYIFAQPQNLAGPRLWAKPVVATPAMTIDKFLVGGFKLQTLYDRMSPEVLIASENSDDFEKNLYTMRCEERIALAVKKPGALIYGDFGNV
jgi:HK97 family phage major capsid protein